MFLVCLFVASSVSAQYDSDEKDMIASASEYKVEDMNANIYNFKGENISFWYKESNNEAQGQLIVGDVTCDVYGIYMSEGMYFGSVWCKGKSRGVIYWDYTDGCMTIINKVDSKTYEGEVCRVN